MEGWKEKIGGVKRKLEAPRFQSSIHPSFQSNLSNLPVFQPHVSL